MKSLVLFLTTSTALLAQGPLAPSGGPAPTMKSLQQVEPRVPVSAAPFAITAPGSYYLTANLAVSAGDAITIGADHVSLDLNGFAITSTASPADGTAITISGNRRNITVRNGVIAGAVTQTGGVFSGAGFAYGVVCSGTDADNIRVSRLCISGCQNTAITTGPSISAVIEDCTVATVGGTGISSVTISRCTAVECGGNAINGRVVDLCVGESLGGIGIQSSRSVVASSGVGVNGRGIQGGVVRDSYGQSTGSDGVFGTLLQNCQGQSTSGTGVNATRSATSCHGSSSTGVGISAPVLAFCTGSSTSAAAIQGTVANSCHAITGSISVTNKYNMP